MYSWILLGFEAYLVLNRPHFERSAGGIVGVKSTAAQGDWPTLRSRREVWAYYSEPHFCITYPGPVREIIFYFIKSIVGIWINIV